MPRVKKSVKRRSKAHQKAVKGHKAKKTKVKGIRARSASRRKKKKTARGTKK